MARPKSRARELAAAISAAGDPERAAFLQGFLKTGPGEYAEGDVIAGVRVPQMRAICRAYRDLTLDDAHELLASPIHEHRFSALIILADQAKAARRRDDADLRKSLYDFYLAHADRVNHWDLVDTSCRALVGDYLYDRGDPRPLRKLARSKLLWERRIAMVSTYSWIRNGELDLTFELAELQIDNDHDLMHKAVGWMLREAGKRDEPALERFLAKHAAQLPRTALRYAIERLPEDRRRHWMAA